MFWRKKKTPEFAARLRDVPAELSLRRFFLDSGLPEAQQLQTIMGLTPLDLPSEISESDERASEIEPMAPMIALYASTMTLAVVEYLRTVSETDMDDDTADYLTALLGRVSMATSVGTITQLEDLGFLRYQFRSQS